MSQSGSGIRTSGPGAFVQTLTGNTGGPVGPIVGNINVVGDGILVHVTGTPATHTLEITLDGSVPDQFNTDAGTAFPSTGILNIFGSNLLNTAGSGNTVTVALDLSLDGQIPIGSSAGPTTFSTITAGSNVTVTNGHNSITIAANTGAIVYNYVSTNDAASPYTVAATNYYIGVDSSAGVVSILLPNAPTTGRAIVVKDKTGSAATNNITITTVGGAVLIDGATSFVMNTNYEAVSVLFNGVSWEVY